MAMHKVVLFCIPVRHHHSESDDALGSVPGMILDVSAAQHLPVLPGTRNYMSFSYAHHSGCEVRRQLE